MNDYTCPKCHGTGGVDKFDDKGRFLGAGWVCPMCNGNQRLPDRRSKTVSDRRQHGFENERRKNYTFTDRRKRI